MYVKSVWRRPPASPSCNKVTSQLSLERNCECFLVCQKWQNFRFHFVGKKSDLIRSNWNVWDLWTRGSHSLVGSTENLPSHMDKPIRYLIYPEKISDNFSIRWGIGERKRHYKSLLSWLARLDRECPPIFPSFVAPISGSSGGRTQYHPRRNGLN